MGLISGTTIIRSISLFHLTLAYFFMAAPQSLSDQNLVFILGESMGLPHVQSFNMPSAPTSLLAVVLAFLGISDLLAVSMPDEVAQYHWGNQAPIRLLFFFVLTGYTYLFKPGGLAAPKTSYTPSAGDALKNSLVFTWAFVEMVTWFWIYVSLRDDRRQEAARIQAKRRAEEDSL